MSFSVPSARAPDRALLEQVFDEADTNGDRQLSREEYERLLLAHPDILQPASTWADEIAPALKLDLNIPVPQGGTLSAVRGGPETMRTQRDSGYSTVGFGGSTARGTARGVSFSPALTKPQYGMPGRIERDRPMSLVYAYYLGPLIFALLGLIPVWNLIVLKDDATYQYFGSPSPPLRPIFSGFFVVFFVLLVIDASSVSAGEFWGTGGDASMTWIFRCFTQIRPNWSLESVVVTITIILLALLYYMMPSPVEGAIGIARFTMEHQPSYAHAFVLTAVSIFVFYVLSLQLFSRYAPEKAQHAGSVFLIWSVYVLLLGVVMVLFSEPLTREASLVPAEIWSSCGTGPITKELYDTSQALQALRASPRCAELGSVEDCRGFGMSRPSAVLKAFESQFHCAGWCYQGPDTLPAFSESFSMNVTIVETPSTGEISDLQLGPQLALTQHYSEEHKKSIGNVGLGSASPYPPTLFSERRYQASCDGAVARNFKLYVAGVGQEMLYEGVFLVIISSIIGILKLVGICISFCFDQEFKEKIYGNVLEYGSAEGLKNVA